MMGTQVHFWSVSHSMISKAMGRLNLPPEQPDNAHGHDAFSLETGTLEVAVKAFLAGAT